MKAIIPVAGIGTKLRPHTHTQPKALVPVAGKPILGHIIDFLLAGGIRDFVFITGYLGEKIEAYVRQNYADRFNLSFVTQEPREGSAHALWVAKDTFQKEKELVILLGDTIVSLDLVKFLKSENSILAVKKVDNPTLFGVAQVNEKGIVKSLVEKPKIPKSNLALVGLYKINNVKLFTEALKHLMKSSKQNTNEYHLTDALAWMIPKGELFNICQVDNWFDCGRKETLLEANQILMNRPGFIHKTCKNAVNSIIIPPVSLGEGAKVIDSIVGPDVAVGENTLIQSSIIRDSIIGSYSEIQSSVLENSIIGNDSSLMGMKQSLNLGDNTEINFSK